MPAEKGSFNQLAKAALGEIAREHGVSVEDLRGRQVGLSLAKRGVMDIFLTDVAHPMKLTKSESARVLGVNRGTVYNRSRRLGLF